MHVIKSCILFKPVCPLIVTVGGFQAATQPPPPPPSLSPPPLTVPQLTNAQGTSESSIYGAPISPEVLTTVTDDEEEDENIPLCQFPREQLRVLDRLGHGQFGEVSTENIGFERFIEGVVV
jgi:hypothetical protein